MKPTHVRLLSVFLCITLAFAIICYTRVEIHGAAQPLLYYNDRQWKKATLLPAEKRAGIYYVPILLFHSLPDVGLDIDIAMHTFIISHGDRYLSFNINNDFAVNQDKKNTYLPPAEYHGEYYVHAQSVCKYLGLSYEEITSPITGETAIRICDGNQTTTFRELLDKKHPGFLETEPITSETTAPPVTDTTVPPDTSGPDTDTGTDTTIPAPVLTDRVIYLTVEDSPGEYTEEILDVLEEFGVPATFFVIGDQLLSHADTLSRIAADGHAIALHTMSHDAKQLTDAAAILADIETQNTLLARLTKQISHIWRAPEGSAKLKSLTDEAAKTLYDNGYLIWDADITAPASARTAKSAAQTVIDGIWENETVTIRFTENKLAAETLRIVLAFIAENREVCDMRVISPAFDAAD